MTNEEINAVVDRAEDEYDRLKDRVHEQYDEIKRLKEEYMILQNASDEVEEELQQRIDKAIEYINNKEFIDYKKGLGNLERMLKHRQDLLDILKGSNKE